MIKNFINFSDELKVDYVKVPKYRTKKIQVILIAGKKQSGKSTTSDYLYHELVNKYQSLSIEQRALAEPIKTNAMEFFEWDENKDEKGRRLLQEIGDAGRNYDEDIFCRKLENNILDLFPPNIVIIDDWRYQNEAEFFKKEFLYEVTTIRIERPMEDKTETARHKSENSLPTALKETLSYCDDVYNFTIFNNGTIEELYKKLDSIISYLETKIITY